MKEEISAWYNIETLYKKRNSVITFFDDYSAIVSESKFKETHGRYLNYENLNKCFKNYQQLLHK